MRTRIVLLLCAASALTVGVATANAGKANKTGQACYKGAFANYYDPATGGKFASEEACVSYVAQGGTLTTKTKSQLDCEAIGGTFSTDPATSFDPSENVAWTCNGWAFFSDAVEHDCFSDGGYSFSSWSYPASYSTCYRQ
jgi:hypothetical protein